MLVSPINIGLFQRELLNLKEQKISSIAQDDNKVSILSYLIQTTAESLVCNFGGTSKPTEAFVYWWIYFTSVPSSEQSFPISNAKINSLQFHTLL